MLQAMATHARGALALADGSAEASVGDLRDALRMWQTLDARYQVARVRILIAMANRQLGDEDGADLEFDAATIALHQLGALPDLSRVDSLKAGAPSTPQHGLTKRELQVLRLVTSGKTNRAIGAELFVSAKTVDRHLSNIFAKLNVSSRAAATAYAIKHQLV